MSERERASERKLACEYVRVTNEEWFQIKRGKILALEMEELPTKFLCTMLKRMRCSMLNRKR